MVAILFVLLFIAVPVIELWLILQVGELIGVLPTIAILLIDSLLGAWLVRNQGGAVWRRFRKTVDDGRIPAGEAIDGFLVVLGGTLLLVPGFLSDAIGLAFILPPTRKLMRGRALSFLTRRTRATFMGGFVADDIGVRDFSRSDQPRRRPPSTSSDGDAEFDFETHQLHE